MSLMESERESKRATYLTESTRRAFAENLTAAINVGGDDKEDSSQIKKMKLTELNEKTKISRSTLSKLVNGKTSNGTQANPDLETICRLAASLNISPAFLLMSSDDWKRLISMLDTLKDALCNNNIDNALAGATENAKVKVGLNLATDLKLYSETDFHLNTDSSGARQVEIERNLANEKKMQRLSILSTTAMTQHAAKSTKETVMLTAIGAILGASFSIKTPEV